MQSRLLAGKANLSLVAHYGEKPPGIESLITEAQEILQSELPLAFEKYDISQVHATLISLEGHRAGDAIVNANYSRFYHERRLIDFDKAFELLKKTDLLPFGVKIGGYKKHGSFPFTSRGAHPYQRSFSVQNDIMVAMGWPYDSTGYPRTLDRLRRSFNQANILHKYHQKADDTDNDFYFVLGNVVRAKTSNLELGNIHDRMIQFLANHEPVPVTIARESLRIIAYTDPKAPPATTCSYTLDEAEEKLDELKSLYQDVEA